MESFEEEIRHDIKGCPYFLLQVKFMENDPKVISKSYKQLVQQHHPDPNPGLDDSFCKRLNAARDFLEDEEKKQIYDSWLVRENIYSTYTHLGWSQKLGDDTQENQLTPRQRQEEADRKQEIELLRRVEAERQVVALREAELERLAAEKKREDEFLKDEAKKESIISGIKAESIFEGYVQAYKWILSRYDYEEVLRECKSEELWGLFEQYFQKVYPDKTRSEYLTCDNVVAKMVFEEMTYREYNMGMYKNAFAAEYNKGTFEKEFVYLNSDFMEFISTLFMKVEHSCHILTQNTLDTWRRANLAYLPVVVDDYRLTHWDKFTRKDYTGDANRLGTDVNFIRLLCDRDDRIFIMPIHDIETDSEHFTVVVRRWFEGELHFFYADSWDEDSPDLPGGIKNWDYYKKNPRNVQIFLMNSPLWKENQKAYWSRIPNPKQVEFECGYRTILHGVLLATSSNPFQCLSTLKKFMHQRGQKKQGKKFLNNMIREWVHDCIKDDTFIFPSWYRDLQNDCPSFTSLTEEFKDWRDLFCREIQSNKVHLVTFCMTELKNQVTIEDTTAKRGKTTQNVTDVPKETRKQQPTPNTPKKTKGNKKKKKGKVNIKENKKDPASYIAESTVTESWKSGMSSSGEEETVQSSNSKKGVTEQGLQFEINMDALPVNKWEEEKFKETSGSDVEMKSDVSSKKGFPVEKSSDDVMLKTTENPTTDNPGKTASTVESMSESNSNDYGSDIGHAPWANLPRADDSIWKCDMPKKTKTPRCNCVPGSLCDESCNLFHTKEQCGFLCPAGDTCQNNTIRKKIWKATSIIQDTPKGRGVQSDEDLKKGALIVEYTGEIIVKKQVDEYNKSNASANRRYIIGLEGDYFIDATTHGSICKYVNHSCNPNCTMEKWHVDGIPHLVLTALQDIKRGEELTFDYNWSYSSSIKPTKCLCGQKKCRMFIEKDYVIELDLDDDIKKDLPTNVEEPILVFPFDPGERLSELQKAIDEIKVTEISVSNVDFNYTNWKKKSEILDQRDRDSINGTGWVNDSIINFWCKFVESMLVGINKKVYIFNNHFFNKLKGGEKDEQLKRWYKKAGKEVLETELLIIPVAFQNHWSLIVVFNLGFDDLTVDDDDERTYDRVSLWYFDSLNIRHWGIKTIITDWLNRLICQERGTMFKEVIKMHMWNEPKVPRQTNNYDCGFFVCKYLLGIVELLQMKGLEQIDFNRLSDTTQFQFSCGDIPHFRTKIGQLIDLLSQFYKREGKPPSISHADGKESINKLYTVSVPIVEDRIFVHIGDFNKQSKYYHHPCYATYFAGYTKQPDGSISPAEEEGKFRAVGDIIIAVNGEGVRGKSFDEVVALVSHFVSERQSNAPVTFRMLENREEFNKDIIENQEGEEESVSQSLSTHSNSATSTKSHGTRSQKVSPQVTRSDLSFLKKTYSPGDFFEYKFTSVKTSKTASIDQWVGIGTARQVILSKDWIMTFYGSDFCNRLMKQPNRALKPNEKDLNWKQFKPIISIKYVSKDNSYFGYSDASDCELLTSSWIENNFHPSYLDQIHANVNKKVFVRAGSAKRKVECVRSGFFPAVMYRQSGLHTCVVSSLASGFVYFKDHGAVKALMNKKNESLQQYDIFHFTSVILIGKELGYHVKKINTKSGFDVLTDISCYPTVVQLLASNGTTDHAITTVGPLIFDSNSQEAQMLSQSALDRCCGIDDVKIKYQGFHYAHRYLHTKPKKDWYMCDNCREGKGAPCQFGITLREVKK